MDAQLAKRAILVTGASGGIGGAVVRAFHREGANVIVHYHKNRQRAEEIVRELGDRCLAIGADLTNEDEVAELFTRAEDAYGAVDSLIANAGKWPPQDIPIADMELSHWYRTLDANLTSAFLCTRRFLQGVKAVGLLDPSIVLVGSTAAIFGEAGHGDYASAKAAITYGFCQTLKNEIARITPRGRVNVVCPGWTFTPMTRRFADDPDRVRRVLQTIPLRKVGRPEDVANTIVFLASNALSGHITGQSFTVSGGMEGRLLYSSEEVDPERA